MANSLKKNPNKGISSSSTQKTKIIEEEFYKSIFTSIDDLIAVFNEKIECEFVNSTALMKILGYTFDEIKGKNSIKLIHPEDLQKGISNFNSAFKTGNSFGESRVKCKDGTYKWLQNQGTILKTIDGNEKLIIISRDITDIIESEKKYEFMLENSNDLITIISENLKHEYINEAAYRNLLGYSKEDIIGKSPLTPIHPDDQNRAIKAFKDGFKKGEGKNEMRIKHKEGHYLWFENKGKVFTDSEGKRKAIIISRDITDRKKIESKLKDQNAELEKLNELKSEFLRRATHELKTPLVAIKGYTDLLMNLCDKQENSEIKINLHNILHGCERLEHLIKNILESSKLKSSKIKLIKKRVNLTNLIKSCIEEQNELCNSRNHTLELIINENLFLHIDKEQIYEVITNLLRNAFIYTPPNGTIIIQTEAKSGFVLISIKDSGVGFTKKEKEKAFQQFGKINRADQGIDLDIEGSGLGLFITKEIIEAHKGQILLESEGRNRGTTVSFSLPRR
jgi:PAS domain S-box-containing protein